MADDPRFPIAVEAIDAANAEDPNQLLVHGDPMPKALGEGVLVSAWVRALDPAASDALLLAARAHHVRRWTSPRSSYPEGRAAYLRWRRDLHEFHAAEVERLLAPLGYEPQTIARVQDLVRKRELRAGTDPEVQTLEDAICLAFLEAELAELADRIDPDRMVEILRRTIVKMSPAALAAAATIPLRESDQALLARALSPED